MKRETRLARQEYDDGAESDEVYVRRTTQQGGSYTYHDDPTCRSLVRADDEAETMTRLAAQRRWKAPCEYCVLEIAGGPIQQAERGRRGGAVTNNHPPDADDADAPEP